MTENLQTLIQNIKPLQAYSRINRILNSVKTYGNIVCFRKLQKEKDEAMALFKNREACEMVLLKSYNERLKSDETKQFIIQSFKVGETKTTGSDIDKLMPSISRFGSGNRNMKKQNIIEKLKAFFEKYFDIVITDMINQKDI